MGLPRGAEPRLDQAFGQRIWGKEPPCRGLCSIRHSRLASTLAFLRWRLQWRMAQPWCLSSMNSFFASSSVILCLTSLPHTGFFSTFALGIFSLFNFMIKLL